MSNNTQNLLTFTLAPSGTYDVDINVGLETIKFMTWEVDVVYGATAATTGVGLNLYSGNGNADPTVLIGQAPYYFALPVVPGGSSVADYGGNPYPTTMTTTPPNKGTSQTVKTYGFLNGAQTAYGSWVKFRFTNNDATNSATVTFSACI